MGSVRGQWLGLASSQGLGEALGPSTVSGARIYYFLSSEGALTFKAWVKEGPSQPTEPQAPSTTHSTLLPRDSGARGIC